MYKVLSWEQLNYNLFSALKLEKVVMIIVISLIIIVACFIIVTNLIMMGIQKSKDIGILMSMGSSRKEIGRIFFIQGIVLNISGIILGTVLGLVLSFLIKRYQFVKLPKEVYYIDTIPIYISVWDLTTVLLITIIVGILASFYPAKKVSHFDPIEIIRYG
ncbi:MAG: FtsX-like permease family protein [Endomicrobiia bacterium]